MSASQPRKRRCVYEDNRENNTSSISEKKLIIVQQNNNQLLQTIINNQQQLQNQIFELQEHQNKKFKKINNQIHNLQINISNFETTIPEMVKDKLKDCIGEIIFTLQDNFNYQQQNIQHQQKQDYQQYQDYQQEEETTQEISSRLNYLL